MRKKQVRVDFDPDEMSRDEVADLLTRHADEDNIEDDYEIEEKGGDIRAHFDVSESVEHPDRFLFTAFTAYAKTAWHNFD